MVNRELLMEYVKIIEEYVSNPTFVFNDEQRNIINLINKEAKNDERLSNLLNELKNSNDKYSVIDKYFGLTSEKKENEYEVISSVFGVDISKIEHKKLSNGKEIFGFYDTKTNKNIFLENNRNGISLVEQLKEEQVQNKNNQTDNFQKNAEDILKEKVLKENCELRFYSIDEISNHINEVKGLTLEDYHRLIFLVKNANSFGIQSINIENVIGLDFNGKIYKVYKDSSYEFKIGEPNTLRYNEENITISDRVQEDYTISQQNMALQSDYEDIPSTIENISEDIEFDYLDNDIKEKTIMYYENPELLKEEIQEKREQWQKYINYYKKKLELEERKNIRKQSKKKVLTRKKEENYGFIDMSIIISIIGIIVAIISVILVISGI